MTDSEAIRSHILDLGAKASEGDSTSLQSLCATVLLTSAGQPPTGNVVALSPNEETMAAIAEASQGLSPKFDTVEDLIADLESDDEVAA